MLNKTYQKIYSLFEKSEGYLPTRALLDHRISTIHIRELCDMGEIERISHGNYWGTFLKREKPSDYRMVEACMTNDKSVICGPSACFYHGLLSREPVALHVATLRTDRAEMKMNFPVVRHYFSIRTFEDELITYTQAGIRVRVYGMDRSICDCIRIFEKNGESAELSEKMLKEMVRNYKNHKEFNPEKVYAYADQMRVGRIVRSYLA